MALPPEKLRAYGPLIDMLVDELLREYDAALSDAETSNIQADSDRRALEHDKPRCANGAMSIDQ